MKHRASTSIERAPLGAPERQRAPVEGRVHVGRGVGYFRLGLCDEAMLVDMKRTAFARSVAIR